jgi:hypothetical protein
MPSDSERNERVPRAMATMNEQHESRSVEVSRVTIEWRVDPDPFHKKKEQESKARSVGMFEMISDQERSNKWLMRGQSVPWQSCLLASWIELSGERREEVKCRTAKVTMTNQEIRTKAKGASESKSTSGLTQQSAIR